MINLYDIVTDGRRIGVVTEIRGAMALVSYSPSKRVPEEWAELFRSYEPTPLMDIRPLAIAA